jgi:hypothetical protein
MTAFIFHESWMKSQDDRRISDSFEMIMERLRLRYLRLGQYRLHVKYDSAAYHFTNHHQAIIYGDYYFMEAIFKQKGNDLYLL